MSNPFASPAAALAPTSTTPRRAAAIAQSPRGRKSPPPPKLNLDDCKPIIATTTTNTSTNAAANPSTAFVFTSSRLLRNLHNVPPSPVEEAQMESPGSPAASASYGSTPRSSRAPSLSPAQLASHSMGAVDARCIVSPNMRAAGFIPLPHSPHHQPSHLAGPSTALPSAVPTPIDPPRFPPIVFINPTNVASTPMWEYQRTLEYGLPSGKSAATGQGLGGPSKHASRPAVHPMPRMGEKHSDDSVTSLASDSTAFGSSSSSLFLGGESAHSSMTSVASSTVQSPDSGKSLSQRMHGLGLGEPHVDGYPFPVTPPRSRVDLHDAVQPLRQPAPLLPSPAIGSSPDSGPMRHVSSPASVSPRSSSASESPATSSSGSRPAVSRRGTEPHALSITELCFNSPSAWLADPTILPHFMSTPAMRTDASRGRSRAVSTSRMVAGGRGAALSDAGSSVESKGSAGVEEEPVQVVKAEEVVVEAKEVVAAVEMERTATLKPVEEEEEDEIAKEKRREKHRGREKDKGKGKERYRHKTKSNKSHSSSSPTSTASSPQRDGKGKERVRTKTKEAKSTKEKARQTSPYTFATFFPPRDHRATPAHPHTLGAPDALRDREREREAGQFAKDQVLARRERDRRLAREDHHDERDRSSQHKVRVATAPTDRYTTVYDAGRGRGVGRGERGRGRGRSVSSSAGSFVSDGATMVQDAPDSEPVVFQA